MSGYTLTITTYGPQPGAQTTINVDTASGSPRITELTVRPAEGAGLSPDQLPVVDLPGLILALAPPVGPAAVTAAPQPAPEPGPAPAASRARAPRGRAASARSAPSAGSRRGGRRTPEPTVKPAAEDRGSRAYRRMPEPDEVVAAYRQSGGATALARHFGVPRHTANGWLRRLRGLGLIETTS